MRYLKEKCLCIYNKFKINIKKKLLIYNLKMFININFIGRLFNVLFLLCLIYINLITHQNQISFFNIL